MSTVLRNNSHNLINLPHRATTLLNQPLPTSLQILLPFSIANTTKKLPHALLNTHRHQEISLLNRTVDLNPITSFNGCFSQSCEVHVCADVDTTRGREWWNFPVVLDSA